MSIFSKRSRNRKDVSCDSVSGDTIILKIIYYDITDLACEITVSPETFLAGDLLWILLSLFVCGFLGISYNWIQFFTAFFIAAAGVVLNFIFRVKSESLLIVPSVGIQFSTSSYLGRKTSWFVPWSLVDDVVINEGITTFCVRFYLVLLITDEHSNRQLKPLFQLTQPRLACLEEIYHACQRSLKLKRNQQH